MAGKLLGHALKTPARVIGIYYRCLLATGLSKGNMRRKGDLLDYFEKFQEPLFDVDEETEVPTPIDETGPGCARFGWVDGLFELPTEDAAILEKGFDVLTADGAPMEPNPQGSNLNQLGFPVEVAKAVIAAAEGLSYWRTPSNIVRPNLFTISKMQPHKRTKYAKPKAAPARKKAAKKPTRKATKKKPASRAKKKAAKKKAKKK